ncbi:CPK2, partial [Symbiodinium necroappetens]
MLQRIAAGRFATERDAWKNASPSAKDFVCKLLTVEARRRPDADQALQHPWISKRDSVARSYVSKDIVDALCSFSEASAFRRACLLVMAISLSNEERAEVHKAFLEIDKDHSGTITLSELRSVLEEKFHIEDAAVA